MPKRIEENAYIYNYKKLNFIFFFSSLVLLGCIGLMIYYDYNREWKNYQRKFQKEEKNRLLAQIKEEQKKLHEGAIKEELENLEMEKKEAQKILDEKKEDIAKLQHEIISLKNDLYKINQLYEFTKAKTNYLKWQIEQDTAKGKKHVIERKNKQFLKLLENQNKLQKDVQNIEYAKKDKEKQLYEYELTLNKIIAKQENIKKREKELYRQKKEFDENFQNIFRNLPVVDYISPTLNIKQIVLPHLYEDYHFTKVPKIDRCMTCHLNIDKSGFENAPQPFTSHPRLELFAGDFSYHPVNKFGCTVCHAGSGRATTFFGASHTPKNEEQKKEWIKKYKWHENHLWDFPMIPSQFLESSCLKCHSQQAQIPFAPRLNKGKMILQNSGCFGCHKIEGLEKERVIGPTLINIDKKISNTWTEEWLKNPKDWNSNARMPQVFFLSNTSTEDDAKINNVFIKGITTYLYDNSFPTKLENIPQDVKPNIEEGKKLFSLKGCIACHTIGQELTRDNVRKFGPDLSGTGTKLSGENGLKWLYNWIKNPQSIFPATKMPNMQLSDKEALYIAQYLQTLTNTKNILGVKDVDTKTLKDLTEYYMLKKYNINDLKNFDAVLNTELLNIKKSALEDYLEHMATVTPQFPAEFIQDMKGILITIMPNTAELTINHEFDKLKEKYKKFEQYIEEIKKMVVEKINATKAMDTEKKKLTYIGHIGILRQGCFGCHEIFGFAKMPKIGVELTGSNAIGSKDIEKLDSGYIDIPKTRWAWLAQKLKDPRIFDKGKILNYDEKLRMPQFHLKNEEIEYLLTFLLGLTNEDINPQIKRNLSYNELTIEKGKNVAINKNCISCHLLTKDTVILYDPIKNEYNKLEGIIRQYNPTNKVFSFSNLTPDSKYPFNIVKRNDDFYQVKNIFFGLGAYAKDDILTEEALIRGISEDRKNELSVFAPPPLYYEGFKVQKNWLSKFLRDPFPLRPWLKITMPKFTFDNQEINNLIGFFSLYSHIDTSYEYYHTLSSEYISKKLKQDKEYLKKAKEIFEKLECVKCHIVGNKQPQGDPENWAPDLLIAKERLNPQWMIKWLQNPQQIQPGTKMPTFYEEGNPPETIKDYFENDSQKQIEAIIDYITHSLKEDPSSSDSK